MNRHAWMTTLLVCIAAALAGCDSTYSYKPVTATGERIERSAEKIGNVKFSMGPYEPSTTSKSILQHLFIDNGSNADVLVLNAVLETDGKTIPAKIYEGAEGEKERTVPAKFSNSVGLPFFFGGPAAEVLGKDIVWIWQLHIGQEEQIIRVPMRRE